MRSEVEHGYLWNEALPELLEEEMPGAFDHLTTQQWESVSVALNEHVSNSRDFMPPVPSAAEVREINERPEMERLRRENETLQKQLSIFEKDVQRHVTRGRRVYADVQSERVVIVE